MCSHRLVYKLIVILVRVHVRSGGVSDRWLSRLGGDYVNPLHTWIRHSRYDDDGVAKWRQNKHGSAYCIYDVLDIFTEAQLHCYLKRRLSSLRIQPLLAHYLPTMKSYAHFLQGLTPLSTRGLPSCAFVQCNVESTFPVRSHTTAPRHANNGSLVLWPTAVKQEFRGIVAKI